MYYLKKTIVIAGAHSLDLPYESACNNIHGHNWRITIYCRAQHLDAQGMVVDFKVIKKAVMRFDHSNLNATVCTQPTAERIATCICEDIKNCYRVDVEESPGSVATYEKDA